MSNFLGKFVSSFLFTAIAAVSMSATIHVAHSAVSTQPSSPRTQIARAVSAYEVEAFLNFIAKKHQPTYAAAKNNKEVCPPPVTNSQACIDAACTRLGSWNCDSIGEIQQVAEACRGNYDATCLESSCTRLGSWNCDSIGEIQQVAESCRGNFNGACTQTVCERIGSWNCDSMDEIAQVNSACKYADSACVDAACTRLGSWNCDSIGEITEVARMCGGGPVR